MLILSYPSDSFIVLLNSFILFISHSPSQMSYHEFKKEEPRRKMGKPNEIPKKEHISKHQKSSFQPRQSKLFESGRLLTHKDKKSSQISEKQLHKLHKIATTDESNNAQQSKLHESVFISQKKMPNEEYFHQPLTFKQKKLKFSNKKRHSKQTKLQELSIKIGEMNQLVYSQEKELKTLKSSMSERQLHRLIKIHSIEKLKKLQQMCVFKESLSIKNSKKL